MGLTLRIVAASLALQALAAGAQDDTANSKLRIAGVPLGSGVPVAGPMPASHVADPVGGGDYHVPNFLPGYPTAATLWPREVHVPCRRDEAADEVSCAGYDVSPWRGEYIYVRPVIFEKVTQPVPPLTHKKPLG